jgi:hypothetical protein
MKCMHDRAAQKSRCAYQEGMVRSSTRKPDIRSCRGSITPPKSSLQVRRVSVSIVSRYTRQTLQYTDSSVTVLKKRKYPKKAPQSSEGERKSHPVGETYG